jgi:peptidyl-prolyl cis-trans isomerase C
MQKKIIDLASKQQPPMSSEEFLAKVHDSGLKLEDFQKELRRNMGYFKLFEDKWTGKTDVTDQDAKAHYDKNPGEFKNPEMVRASHILIQPNTQPPGVDPNQAKAQAKAKAEDLLSKIRGGEDFAELAKAHSSCPSAANGGDLDYFKRGEMDAPFEKVAFELVPGQVSGVVETQFGFHIIKVVDHKAARTLPFEEAKAGIVEKLTAEKKTQIIRDYVESLKAKAQIQYTANK